MADGSHRQVELVDRRLVDARGEGVLGPSVVVDHVLTREDRDGGLACPRSGRTRGQAVRHRGSGGPPLPEFLGTSAQCEDDLFECDPLGDSSPVDHIVDGGVTEPYRRVGGDLPNARRPSVQVQVGQCIE